jgi:hypothetical protein
MDFISVSAPFLLVSCFVLLALFVVRRGVHRAYELRRFEVKNADESFFGLTRIARGVLRRPATQLVKEGRLLITAEELRRLQDIGTGDASAVVRYVVLREGWIGITVLVCFYSLSTHTALFAAFFTCAAIVLAVWVPRGLLDLEWEAQRRAVRLEIPIVFGLLASTYRASSEVVRVFEDCADILYGKQNRSTLANALMRAKWRSRVMGSWLHGLTSEAGSSSGPLVDDALGKLSRVVQPEEEDIDGKFQAITSEALGQLQRELVEHNRLVAIKVVVILSAGSIGGVLLSGLPLWGSWGG